MAKSANYFGLRQGSTKSLTFSIVDGSQITKDRVLAPKNPRTPAQMTQRCMVGTIGTAYGAMKSVCNHSFEDVTAGMQCMRTFMSENLKQLRICKEYENGFFGFSKYKDSGLVPGSYIISKGSLPDSCPEADILSVDAANKQISIDVAAGNSIADITDSMGCKIFKDTCTIAIMYPKGNGSYGFGAVRFTYKQGETVLESFDIDVFGDVNDATAAFGTSGLSLNVHMKPELAGDATTENTYMVAIASRQVNGNWHRSNAQFDVQNATPTYAQAIATYPVGMERILNGSSTTSYTDGGSNNGGTNSNGSGGSGNGGNSGGSGSITTGVAAPSINGNAAFTTSTQVTMSGPDGAEIRYTSDGSTPTASSTLYTEAITVSSSVTLKAIAIKDGQSSQVTTKQFVKNTSGADDPSGFEGA